MILNTLVYIYGVVLLISTLATFFTWLRFRHQMIRLLLLFWLSGILAFFSQGLFNQTDELGLLAFGTNVFSIYFGLNLYSEAIGSKKKLKFETGIAIFSLIVGFLITHFTENFFLGSLVFCVGCTSAALIAIFSYEKQLVDTPLNKGFRWFLVIAALHFLDYPFLRTHESLAIAGFSISLVLHFCFAVYVPILIMQRMSSEYVSRLEFEVEQRTHQLSESNSQLQQTFSQLKENKEKMDFLLQDTQMRMSTLVHDIANPLQVISTNVEVMSINKENLQQIFENKSARLIRAVDTIMNILSDARKTHSEIIGKTELSLKSVDLKEMIQDCLKDVEDRLRKKNISVNLQFPNHTECRALAHESWLRNQVLMNLISNAIKFSYSGGLIRLSIDFVAADKVSILIEDFGVGISKEKAETLFSLDQKTSTRGTSGEKGTGLGLPIVKQYLELMGGTVKLVSRQQPGAAFLIELNKAN